MATSSIATDAERPGGATVSANDTSLRTIHLWEQPYDLKKIKDNKWNWQIAKNVSTVNGSGLSNVIWQSKAPAPNYSVQWKAEYGLNWTTDIPASGLSVSVGGWWQPFDKGQVFDIDQDGLFVPSSAPAEEGWMKVGSVNYQYPGIAGIHIVVGLKDSSTGEWSPIFLDTTTLFLNNTAKYQPQESVKWWYSGGNMTGAVFSETATSTGKVDLSNPAPLTRNYEWWTTYLTDSGQWINQQTKPPNPLMVPPPCDLKMLTSSATEVVAGWPVYVVALAIAVAAGSVPAVRNFIHNQLAQQFQSVEVIFTTASGNEIRITYGPPRSVDPHSLAFLQFTGAAEGADHSAIENALTAARDTAHLLPADETWTITP